MKKNDESVVVAEYTRDPATPVTHAIVRGIAAVKGSDPTNLNFALYNHVDPEALETLIRGKTSRLIKIRFSVDDHEVVLANDDTIRILEPM